MNSYFELDFRFFKSGSPSGLRDLTPTNSLTNPNLQFLKKIVRNAIKQGLKIHKNVKKDIVKLCTFVI